MKWANSNPENERGAFSYNQGNNVLQHKKGDKEKNFFTLSPEVSLQGFKPLHIIANRYSKLHPKRRFFS